MRKNSNRTLIVCCILFFSVSMLGLYVIGCGDSGYVTGNPVNPSQPTAVPPQKGNIGGTLVTAQGSPMANLIVILRAAYGSPEVARTTTDSNGKFSFNNITVGSYILEALNSAGAVIASMNASVSANSTTSSQLQEGSILPTPTPTGTPTSTPDPRTPTIFNPPPPPPPGSTSTPTPTGTPPTATPTSTPTGPTPTNTPAPLVRQPHGIAMVPGTQGFTVFVAEYASDSVAYFDPNATTARHITTGIGDGPHWLAVAGNNVYVTNSNSGNLSQINAVDPNQVTAKIINLPAGTNPRRPWGITASSSQLNLYVIDSANNDILNIDLNNINKPNPSDYTTVYHLTGITQAKYISFNSGNAFLYISADDRVLSLSSNFLANPTPAPTPITVGIGTDTRDIDTGANYGLVSNFGSATGSLFPYNDPNAAIRFNAGTGTLGVDIFHNNLSAYVANHTANTITQVSLLGTPSPFNIAGGTLNNPYDINSNAGDSTNIYVSNEGSDTVFRINVIDPNHAITRIVNLKN